MPVFFVSRLFRSHSIPDPEAFTVHLSMWVCGILLNPLASVVLRFCSLAALDCLAGVGGLHGAED